jgi:beta-lactamase class A
MPRIPVAVAAVALSLAGTLPAQQPDSTPERLQQRIARSGATVALYYRDLGRDDSLLVNPDLSFHAASTMKVPIMIQVFRDARAGRLRLDSSIIVENRFRSLADSSTFSLDAGDDSDPSLYRSIGRPIRIRELVERMITVSSNLATNNLVSLIGTVRVRATLRELGADSLIIRRGVENGAAFRAGLDNTTTARALGVVLQAIADGRAASAADCATMLDVLRGQRINDAIPAGLPRHTRIAHKSGWIEGQHHDAAIVYLGGHPRYVLVLLTRAAGDRQASAHLIADLAHIVHEHAEPTARWP